MKKKLKLFTIVMMITAAFVACQKDNNDPTPEATLVIAPTNPIVFTATATESFNVAVNTNQDSWDVQSSQTWCKVAKTGNTFIVTATPNTQTTAPIPAIITISAGKAKSVTISVTQAASVSTYPTTETELKTAITKTWMFPATSDYVSLEFGEGNTYTLLSNKAFTKCCPKYLFNGRNLSGK